MTSSPYSCASCSVYTIDGKREPYIRQYKQSMIFGSIFQLKLDQENHTKELVLNEIAVPFRPIYREAEKQAA
jgi:hypothetical protein